MAALGEYEGVHLQHVLEPELSVAHIALMQHDHGALLGDDAMQQQFTSLEQSLLGRQAHHSADAHALPMLGAPTLLPATLTIADTLPAPLLPLMHALPTLVAHVLAPAGKGAHGGSSMRELSSRQRQTLEMTYRTQPYPVASVRERLGRELNVSARQVQIWFQNRRQRTPRAHELGGEGEGAPTACVDPTGGCRARGDGGATVAPYAAGCRGASSSGGPAAAASAGAPPCAPPCAPHGVAHSLARHAHAVDGRAALALPTTEARAAEAAHAGAARAAAAAGAGASVGGDGCGERRDDLGLRAAELALAHPHLPAGLHHHAADDDAHHVLGWPDGDILDAHAAYASVLEAEARAVALSAVEQHAPVLLTIESALDAAGL